MKHPHLMHDGARLFCLLADHAMITKEQVMVMVGIDVHLAKTLHHKQLPQNFVEAVTEIWAISSAGATLSDSESLTTNVTSANAIRPNND